jgi:hypothetical protein
MKQKDPLLGASVGATAHTEHIRSVAEYLCGDPSRQYTSRRNRGGGGRAEERCLLLTCLEQTMFPGFFLVPC